MLWRRFAQSLTRMLQADERSINPVSLKAQVRGQFAMPSSANSYVQKTRSTFFQKYPAPQQKANHMVVGILGTKPWILVELVPMRRGIRHATSPGSCQHQRHIVGLFVGANPIVHRVSDDFADARQR